MFKLDFNQKLNRVILTLAGNFSITDARDSYAALERIAPQLKKGFMVITDLSGLEVMEEGTKQFFEKIMDLFNARGVSKVVRIIPDADKDIGLNILSLFHYSQNVPIHNYKTLEEAKGITP